MNQHYIYFLILGLAIAGPLALSFDRKVAFYKGWRYVFGAMIAPALFYIGWDIWFTAKGIWEFNPVYITGIRIWNLPAEEALFFFVVPYCCLFIYACIRAYFPLLRTNRGSERILFIIGILLFIIAAVFHDRAYTFYTCIFNAVFIFFLFLLRKKVWFFNSAAFLISYAIILLPFLAVNGILTSRRIVIYNDAENLAVRIFSIPVEDIFYGMLLIMINVVLYEGLLARKKPVSGK